LREYEIEDVQAFTMSGAAFGHAGNDISGCNFQHERTRIVVIVNDYRSDVEVRRLAQRREG
jgi:hypothetical protein